MHHTMHLAISIAIACVLTVAVGPRAHAQAQAAGASTYNVEVIIFRNTGARELVTGSSGRLQSNSDGDSAVDNPQIGRLINITPASRLQLAGLRQKLSAGGYRVLAHAGWTQTASSWGTRVGLPIESLGLDVAGLSGFFLLERGSLLHLGMNLRYVVDGGAAQELNELRRVRFNERNYYDHPGIGVIAVVTPGGNAN
jgi:hypothetical protein